jgi:hypothetical protein
MQSHALARSSGASTSGRPAQTTHRYPRPVALPRTRPSSPLASARSSSALQPIRNPCGSEGSSTLALRPTAVCGVFRGIGRERGGGGDGATGDASANAKKPKAASPFLGIGRGRGGAAGGQHQFISPEEDLFSSSSIDPQPTSGSDAEQQAATGDPTNRADAGAVAELLDACGPRVKAALTAIAADPQGALRQYARDPEVMSALGTVLSRGMAPGRRAAIQRLLAATADEAEAAAAAGGGGAAADSARRRQADEQQGQQQGQQQQNQPEVPAPGKVVAAMFSDPELARLMADPDVKRALAAARGALLSGGGDAAARAALEGRGAKVDRAMELLEVRLGRFVGSPGGTVDV